MNSIILSSDNNGMLVNISRELGNTCVRCAGTDVAWMTMDVIKSIRPSIG